MFLLCLWVTVRKTVVRSYLKTYYHSETANIQYIKSLHSRDGNKQGRKRHMRTEKAEINLDNCFVINTSTDAAEQLKC